MLAGFSLLSYVPIAIVQFGPYTFTRAARRSLYNMPKMDGLFFMQFYIMFLLTSGLRSGILKAT